MNLENQHIDAAMRQKYFLLLSWKSVNFGWLTFIFAVMMTLVLLAGCASLAEQQRAWHSFSINGHADKWVNQVDLLEFSYSNHDYKIQRKVQRGESSINPAEGVGGAIPVGEFLYAKWRIKKTGEIFEDTVDLRSRLPKKHVRQYGYLHD